MEQTPEDRHALAPVLPALRALFNALQRSDVSELEVSYGDLRLSLRQAPSSEAAGVMVARVEVAQPTVTVDAPLTGVFYRRSAPNQAPYVAEGAHLEVGQILGLIEAMKVFNEIRADKSGVVKAFRAGDGQLVYSGDPLLELEPEDGDVGGSAAGARG